MINKIGLMVVFLLGVIVYCKLDERNVQAQAKVKCLKCIQKKLDGLI